MVIKACDELAKSGIKAVPVGCLSSPTRSDISQWSVALLDAESELRSVSLADRIDLIDGIRELGGDSYDGEVLQLIAGSYSKDNFARGALHLFLALMKPWGMVFLDMPAIAAAHSDEIAPLQNRIGADLLHERESAPDGAGYPGEPERTLPEFLLWSLFLPAVAHIIDPHELFAFSGALPFFDELGMARPLAWPYSGATLADIRSRKIIDRYKLEMLDLFSGERSVIEHILNSNAAASVPAKLDGLKSDVEKTLSPLSGQKGSFDDFEKEKTSCRERVLYQIHQLHQRFESARRRREEAVSRQIHRTCNLLAPNGRIQEHELSGIYFLLRYTQSVLQYVYDRLNASTFQHQLILMD